MDHVYFILQKIRETPQVYLEEMTLSAIGHFLCGFRLRAAIANWQKTIRADFTENYDLFMNLDTQYRDCIDGFEEFVRSIYNEDSAGNWVSILKNNSSSKKDAVDLFYRLLDEHIKMSVDDSVG